MRTNPICRLLGILLFDFSFSIITTFFVFHAFAKSNRRSRGNVSIIAHTRKVILAMETGCVMMSTPTVFISEHATGLIVGNSFVHEFDLATSRTTEIIFLPLFPAFLLASENLFDVVVMDIAACQSFASASIASTSIGRSSNYAHLIFDCLARRGSCELVVEKILHVSGKDAAISSTEGGVDGGHGHGRKGNWWRWR